MRSYGADRLYDNAPSYQYIAGRGPVRVSTPRSSRQSRRAVADRSSRYGSARTKPSVECNIAHVEPTLARCARVPTGIDSRCQGVDDDRRTQTRPEALVSDD